MVELKLVRVGQLLFKYRKFVFPAAFITLAMVSPPVTAGARLTTDFSVDALGLVVSLAGEALRVAVIGLAYIKRGGKGGRVYASELVTAGIFAYSRNPLYLGNMLIVFGLAIVWESVWFYVLGLPFFMFSYWCIVLAEEDYLKRHFGKEYEDYCNRVNRFLPSFRGIVQTVKHMTFDWRRVIRKEYGVPLVWISAAFVLMEWKVSASGNHDAANNLALVLICVWTALLAAYVIARSLKKAGVLGTD